MKEEGNDEMYEKYPLKRLEFALNRLIKVTSHHLDILKKQKANIEKYQSLELWVKVESEQVNASRTVQQLKTDIDEMEMMSQHVLPQPDLTDFWTRVDPIRQQILKEIHTFLALHSEATRPCVPKVSDLDLSPSSSLLFSGVGEKQNDVLLQEQKLVTNETNLRFESWERLKQELVDLNQTLHGFARMVLSQGAAVDTIEQNVVTANENVQKGTGFLRKAAFLKAAALPVTGAVIGGILAGPVGLVIGLKAAGACALGGTILGYTGGKFYQKRKLKGIDESVELRTLGSQRSHSLSDLSTGS